MTSEINPLFELAVDLRSKLEEPWVEYAGRLATYDDTVFFPSGRRNVADKQSAISRGWCGPSSALLAILASEQGIPSVLSGLSLLNRTPGNEKVFGHFWVTELKGDISDYHTELGRVCDLTHDQIGGTTESVYYGPHRVGYIEYIETARSLPGNIPPQFLEPANFLRQILSL